MSGVVALPKLREVLLYLILHKPGLTAKELAADSHKRGTRQQDVEYELAWLEENGYIHRDDGRPARFYPLRKEY